jgi:hypothetical protein
MHCSASIYKIFHCKKPVQRDFANRDPTFPNADDAALTMSAAEKKLMGVPPN